MSIYTLTIPSTKRLNSHPGKKEVEESGDYRTSKGRRILYYLGMCVCVWGGSDVAEEAATGGDRVMIKGRRKHLPFMHCPCSKSNSVCNNYNSETKQRLEESKRNQKSLFSGKKGK